MKFKVTTLDKGKTFKIMIDDILDGDQLEVAVQRARLLEEIDNMGAKVINDGGEVGQANAPITAGELLTIFFMPPDPEKKPAKKDARKLPKTIDLAYVDALFAPVKAILEPPETKPEEILLEKLANKQASFALTILGIVDPGNRSAYQALRNKILRKIGPQGKHCDIAAAEKHAEPALANEEIRIEFKLPHDKQKLDLADVKDWFKDLEKVGLRIIVERKKTLVLSKPEATTEQALVRRTAATGANVLTHDMLATLPRSTLLKLQLLGMYLTNRQNIHAIQGFLQEVARLSGNRVNDFKTILNALPELPAIPMQMPASASHNVELAKSTLKTAMKISGRDTVNNFVAMLVYMRSYVAARNKVEIGGQDWTAGDVQEVVRAFAKYQLEHAKAMKHKYPNLQIGWQQYIETSKLMSENATKIAAVYLLYSYLMVNYPHLKVIKAFNILWYTTIGTLFAANVALYNDRERLCRAILKVFDTADKSYQTVTTKALEYENWAAKTFGIGKILDRDLTPGAAASAKAAKPKKPDVTAAVANVDSYGSRIYKLISEVNLFGPAVKQSKRKKSE